MSGANKPHSADQFGPQRNFWWNADFLDLIARRWRFQEVRVLADIGCGQGHWSRLLYPRLAPGARIVGVDREPKWVAEAQRRFRLQFASAPSEVANFLEGDACRIPLPAESCDMVTCQTVLMHLARPLDALADMLRILRPHGLLLCVEPCNLWNYLAFTSLTAAESTDSLVRQFDFWLRCHRGRINSGGGDHNLGALLPGYFAKLGLLNIEVYLSDRAAALFPPYSTPAQRALLAQIECSGDESNGMLDREQLGKLFAQGGGKEEDFERLFPEIVEKFRQERKAAAAGEFHAGGGAITYLVAGRKPASAAVHSENSSVPKRSGA